MKSFCRGSLIVALSLGILVGTAAAQFKNGSQATELTLPLLSQHGVVTQTIGLTTVTVDYHRPLTGGREVFGKVVPYGKVWRAGANENTTSRKTQRPGVASAMTRKKMRCASP